MDSNSLDTQTSYESVFCIMMTIFEYNLYANMVQYSIYGNFIIFRDKSRSKAFFPMSQGEIVHLTALSKEHPNVVVSPLLPSHSM